MAQGLETLSLFVVADKSTRVHPSITAPAVRKGDFDCENHYASDLSQRIPVEVVLRSLFPGSHGFSSPGERNLPSLFSHSSRISLLAVKPKEIT